ncbi:MAG: carboxymuconolactone decarboxylase family protein [Dehalococcoidia bacterium]
MARAVAAQQQGMDEEMVAKLPTYETSDLPERLKLALTLVESWVTAAGQTVDDALMDSLREHYSEKQIVELAIAIGTFDFSHRFNAVMGVEPVHPGTYQTNHLMAPPHMKAHLAELGIEPPARNEE